tara:strand:- start:1578 stop:2252 length:675 start_codon:yes stop_codon:yes gene_type:complete
MIIINKIYDNKMSWLEEVAFILLNFLHDPELIIYLLTIAKPIHFKYLADEARLFHESLRVTRLDRWSKTKELSKMRKFNQMNHLVPVTTTLPFDNGMWKNSCELLKSIRYMRYGFLRRKYPVGDQAEDIDLEIPLKVKCINLLFDDDWKGQNFRGYFGLKEIRESLDDLEIYQEPDMFIDKISFNQLPYLLIEVQYNRTCQSGYSKRKYTFRDNTDLYIQEIMN